MNLENDIMKISKQYCVYKTHLRISITGLVLISNFFVDCFDTGFSLFSVNNKLNLCTILKKRVCSNKLLAYLEFHYKLYFFVLVYNKLKAKMGEVIS